MNMKKRIYKKIMSENTPPPTDDENWIPFNGDITRFDHKNYEMSPDEKWYRKRTLIEDRIKSILKKLLMEAESKPAGDGWIPFNGDPTKIDQTKYELSPGKGWYRPKTSGGGGNDKSDKRNASCNIQPATKRNDDDS